VLHQLVPAQLFPVDGKTYELPFFRQPENHASLTL
jgi:hypothetical protein